MKFDSEKQHSAVSRSSLTFEWTTWTGARKSLKRWTWCTLGWTLRFVEYLVTYWN